ncbi:hypothetical protein DPEC_G00079180 [Dallia pectoralis]|uniref:Uncharacterized protein n=1 Tax=Dallia pectoralis TaxID=75939 RepID=A0ACC2H4A5_DALPE|nr:hypothetical protein DPEC_G00079180 [Dallia pectoralis]
MQAIDVPCHCRVPIPARALPHTSHGVWKYHSPHVPWPSHTKHPPCLHNSLTQLGKPTLDPVDLHDVSSPTTRRLTREHSHPRIGERTLLYTLQSLSECERPNMVLIVDGIRRSVLIPAKIEVGELTEPGLGIL